jgi:prolyl oligopeptidase
MAASWTSLGGVWVHTHLRGGGERDDDFWFGGRMHRKQGTFDDLFAVVEDLHRTGVAVPARTGVWGSSNGGLLVGAAVTQRPELFGAAVAQVPILDLLQSRKDPGTIGIQLADYGNPDSPEDAPVLHAYSPYHNVVDGTAYPAVLLTAGENDWRVDAWHAKKMTARLQEATTSERPVLLRLEATGHLAGSLDQSVDQTTDIHAFLFDQLGVGYRSVDPASH